MNIHKKNKLTYLALILLSLACGFFAYKTVNLNKRLNVLKQANTYENSIGETTQTLARADSLLTNGNYQEALNQYDNLPNTSTNDLELRKTITSKMLELEKKNQQLTAVSVVKNNDSLPKETSLDSPNIKVFDSLASP